MKLQVLQEELSKALSTAIRFTSARGTLPILGNFLLVAEKTRLKIEATNLEMSVSLSIGAKVEEEGSITVPAKIFLELVSNLNPGQLSLNLDKEQLGVASNAFSGNIPTTPANDFPKIPEDIDAKKSFTIGVKALSEALSKVIFSASTDETRPVLTGVLFVFKEKTLNLVSSDGFRLGRKSLPLAKNIIEKNIVIPKSSLSELMKIATSEDSVSFELREADNQLILKSGDIFISTRLIEGNFPDYEKIIPKAATTKILIDKNDLGRGVKLASVFAREATNVVKMKIKENSIELVSESEKAGMQTNGIEAKVDGGNFEISFNFKFIEDFLNIVGGDNIEIKLTDGISPAIFIDPKDPDFLHLIMPVRIQS